MENKSLKVWTGDSQSGTLEHQERQYVFGYHPDVTEGISLTMPVRLQGWSQPTLHPIFQMNLPEGALLDAVRRAISKIIGDDDLSILLATGGNQVGKNRYTLLSEENLQLAGKPEKLDELLTYPNTRELFQELLDRYALRSGISGVQPKVMLDATKRGTLVSSGYIVKSWGDDFPELAANEFFCMTAAKKAGLTVADFHLSENGGLFIMRRFDQTDDGTPLGFEDMCSLHGLGTEQKYRGTYERIAKRLKDFVSPEYLASAREQFFATLILSSLVKNGDAHLKNFGLLFSSTGAPIKMAPVFDIVTTTAYINKDIPALSIAGTKKWWPRKMLESFAVSHLSLRASDIDQIINRVTNAVMETRSLIPGYISNHPEFTVVGEAMMVIWANSVKEMCPTQTYSLSDLP